MKKSIFLIMAFTILVSGCLLFLNDTETSADSTINYTWNANAYQDVTYIENAGEWEPESSGGSLPSGINAYYYVDGFGYGAVRFYGTPTTTGNYVYYVDGTLHPDDESFRVTFYITVQQLTYTVTWNNWDGTTLETDTGVAYGSTPTYDGATPTRPATAQYSYTFSGWFPSVSTVTGNQTYTAQYNESYLQNYTWGVGIGVNESFTLSGFDPTPINTSGTLPTGVSCSVSFYNDIGTVDFTGTPTTTGNYTFIVHGFSTIESEDYDVIFNITVTIPTYTVTWNNWDGTTLETDTGVAYGSTPTYDGATPTKPASGGVYYVFAGWEPEVSKVVGDQTYTAQFTNTAYYDGDWIYNLNNGGQATITSYTGAGGTVQIPQTVGGHAVTGIQSGAFSDDSTITAIVIPPTVSQIGETAFSGTSITQVLNLSSFGLTSNSNGLSGATIYTNIDGLYYLSNVDYTIDINRNDPTSIIIRLIPLAVLLGLFIFIFYRIRDKDNYD